MDNADNRNAHTILAYGLVPDFSNDQSGTFQINDPGVSTSMPTLWQRAVGNSAWKGKWLHGAVAKPISGASILPNTVTLVLHSPGRICVEGNTSKYAIGYVNGTTFTNTFPLASYQFLNPDEDFEPGVDNDPYPPAAEAVQVLTIQARPDEALTVKVYGTGTGAYTLTSDEEVWKNQNLESVYSNVKTGNLTPGAIVDAPIAASGYGDAAIAPTPPALLWEFQDPIYGHIVAGVNRGPGNALYHNPILGGRIFPTGTVLRLVASDATPSISSLTGAIAFQGPPHFQNMTLAPVRSDATYLESKTTLTNPGVYGGYAWAKDALGIHTGLYFTVHVGQYVSITGQPLSATKNEGQQITLTISAPASPPPTFQWYKNGTPISGATSTTYTINSLNASDFGSYYCVAKQMSGDSPMSEATSSSAQIDVIPANPPSLGQFIPPNLTRGGRGRLTGNSFGYNKDAVKILFNGQKFPVEMASGNEIGFKIPPDVALGSSSITVEVYGIVSTNTVTTKIIPTLVPVLHLLQ